jgi:hypothetical protein
MVLCVWFVCCDCVDFKGRRRFRLYVMALARACVALCSGETS